MPNAVPLSLEWIVELSLEGRMREADVGSPSADTGRAISDHRISCPRLIWRRGSQSLMGNFGGSNRSSRWHWHQPRKGRCSDTDDHLSVRANVFRVAPESGHAETEAPCPKCATNGNPQARMSTFMLALWMAAVPALFHKA